MEEGQRGRVRVVEQVPTLDGRSTSYLRFRDTFMQPNLPVLVSGLMDRWSASRDWITPQHQPNFDFIATRYGTSQVQVADCGTKEFNDQKRLDMTIAEFIAYWKRHNAAQENGNSCSLLYLKDWHFVKEYPGYCLYTTPEFFMDDWLNVYLEHHQLHLTEEGGGQRDACSSDYRFVYMGPKGTWTPLHADVFRSYSWSANVCGRKLWHLLPPSDTHLLYDRHKRNTVYNIYADIAADEFPNFHKAGWHECIQDQGQIIFVPSGWYHQVTNLEDTISVNHNWFNAYNLQWVWNLLVADYNETSASIEDIRPIADNFEGLCQRNLAANSGMNYQDFFRFIKRMTSFFFSFLSEGFDFWGSFYMEEYAGVQRSYLKSILKRLFQEVVFNVNALGNVAASMALEKNLCVEKATGSKEDDDIHLGSCWKVGQHLEYMDFLSKLSVTYRICKRTDYETSENVCSLAEEEEDLCEKYAASMSELVNFVMQEDIVVSTVHSPRELVIMIERVVSYLNQCELL